MTHERAQPLLLDLVYGELSPDEAREVERHAADCAPCAAELEGLLATRRLTHSEAAVKALVLEAIANKVFYISPNAEVEPRYRGIGVRIEDDVLVADSGPVVLSAAIPKSLAEVEQACAR